MTARRISQALLKRKQQAQDAAASKEAPKGKAKAKATSEAPANKAADKAVDPNNHLVEPENPLPPVGLDDLAPRLRAAVDQAGWDSLRPVQERAIPYVVEGRDMMVQAQTGTGKTAAFTLPMLDVIDPKIKAVQTLVLVPTRELALQVTREAEMLCLGTDIRIVSVYGGTAYGPQLDAIRAGAHIVIGTPGRILDHLMRGTMKLSELTSLVFDEADQMMSMGFYPDMKKVQQFLPGRLSSYMFSATFPPSVLRLAEQFLHKPGFLSLSHDAVHVSDTEHIFYTVDPRDKDRCLARVFEIENPATAMIFCNTKVKVKYVTTILQRFGFDADLLTSDLAQAAREKVLGKIRNGKLRYLVATDVAARGIDIPNLSHVFIYDFPEDHESYIHRAGRTGRAGATGIAISLCDLLEKSQLGKMAKLYDIDMTERPEPTEEDVEAIVGDRVTALLEAKYRDLDKIKKERLHRFVPLVKGLSECDDESVILAMLVDEYYSKMLHDKPIEPTGPAKLSLEKMATGKKRKPSPGKADKAKAEERKVDIGEEKPGSKTSRSAKSSPEKTPRNNSAASKKTGSKKTVAKEAEKDAAPKAKSSSSPKTPTKAPAKKKAVTKKAAAKKAPAKTSDRKTPAKKSDAKKSVAKKPRASKAAPKKSASQALAPPPARRKVRSLSKKK